jgi:hypothetical protein
MPYLTSQLDTIIATLEAGLGKGYASVTHDGKSVTYRSMEEILKGVAYFKALYNNATDAPVPAPVKVRTFFLFGGKGIGI